MGSLGATVARFIAGGALVALLPLVSQRFGPATAGVLLLFPAVSVVGLVVVFQAQGTVAMQAATLTALVAIPTVMAFLLVTYVALVHGLGATWALVCGIVAWLAVGAGVVAWRTLST